MGNDHYDFLHQPVIGGWRTMLPLSAAILLLGFSAALLSNDLRKLPKAPAPKEGRTWPMDEHGVVVFGTFGETARVYGMFMASFAVGASGFINEKRMRARLSTQDEVS